MPHLLPLLFLCGALSGFLAGLLGIGGGFIVVPALYLLLPHLGVDPAAVPTVSVATSLAAMVPTAASAVIAQHRRRTLKLDWVRWLAPGVACGSAAGSLGAAAFGGPWITLLFALYAAVFALRLLLPRASAASEAGEPPHWIHALPQSVVGCVIGGIAALAGVGGASLVMSYLMARRAEMRQAAAASSAVGLVVACVGAAAFAIAPVARATSSGMAGFIHWPAALAIGAAAIVLAPLGVAASHRLPVCRLRQAFAAMLLALSGLALARGLA